MPKRKRQDLDWTRRTPALERWHKP